MRGHQGDQIDAYLARPLGVSAAPGVVVIHHMPGWDGPTKEIARRFAHHGYVAISPNLHFREGKATPAGEQRQRAGRRRDAGRPDHGRRPGRRRLSPDAAVRQWSRRSHRLLLGRPAVLPGRVYGARPRRGHRLLRRRRGGQARGADAAPAGGADRAARAIFSVLCSGCSAWRTRARRPRTRRRRRKRSTSSARPTSSTPTTTPATPSSPSIGRSTGQAAADRRMGEGLRVLRQAPALMGHA